jgi:hypothetical protein
MERPTPGTHGLEPQALDSIAELLQAAAQHGLGVAFEPDADGWRVSYILQQDWPAWQDYDMSGGQLSNAYDLHIAAAAALKPLNEMGERAAEYFAHRVKGIDL